MLTALRLRPPPACAAQKRVQGPIPELVQVLLPVSIAALPLFMSHHKNGLVEEPIWDEN